MKKTFILLPLIGMGLYLTLSSSSSGGANGSGCDGTGASTPATGCNCHSHTSTFTPTIALKTTGGATVTSYTPGTAYNIVLSASSSSTTWPKFGFQMAAVTAATGGTASPVSVGTYGTMPTSCQVTSPSMSGLPETVCEHSARLIAGGTSGAYTYSVTIPWTAPASGTGSVKLYGVINAVNGSGSSGDGYNEATPVTITESTTGVANVTADAGAKVFPNPCNGTLNIAVDGQYDLHVFDLGGRMVANGSYAQAAAIDASAWAPGLYVVEVMKDGKSETIKVVKQ